MSSHGGVATEHPSYGSSAAGYSLDAGAVTQRSRLQEGRAKGRMLRERGKGTAREGKGRGKLEERAGMRSMPF